MIADAPKTMSAVESAKQRLDKSIARATECFATLRTRLVPVICPRPCGQSKGEACPPAAIPLVGDLDAMTRSVDQLCERIQSTNEELEL